ncbi:P-loop containing nucleoside triphosphate hydrolase protein [Auriscalpium vulgare]|uniref:P-loop containing nucleoside triphosphate hydrolase protein n=1 Tax=Auriscalpium vulgare TaxID=40419 RepID=A0ACB8RKG7_9AGAM|nr:P-loop containing nucleoside triphosphate hydrolase protein [Auriscalpium vulgare]
MPAPFSGSFAQEIHDLSPTAAATARHIFSLVYDASDGKIRLREDQLLPAVRFEERCDVVCIARTGSGKTMQLVIAALLHPDAITLVLSPLKRLQNTTVEELSRFRGVRAVAINSDMHHDFAEWTSIKNGERNLILTSPEQCKPIDGHPTRLYRLQQERTFLGRICRLIVDECHLCIIWGLSLAKAIAFRPAWGKISDLRAKFKSTPLLALTATAPPRILSALPDALGLKDPVVIKTTINRPNQSYAVLPIVDSYTNFQNIRFVLPTSDGGSNALLDFLKRTKKTLIFMDNKDHLSAALYTLYNCLPASLRPHLRKLGLIKLYHSDMSQKYLDKTYASFENAETTFCRILLATSGASTGINVRDIVLLLQYGLCETLEELLQRLGRNTRDEMLRGISLLMFESWAVTPSKKPTAKELRTSDDIKAYATTKKCRRAFLADFADDTASDSLCVVPGLPCCDEIHAFDIKPELPSPILNNKPSNKRSLPAKKNKYRVTWQRAPLTRALTAWLTSESRRSKVPQTYSDYFVLSTHDIANLSRVDPSKLATEDALVLELDQTDSWRSLFAKDLLCELKKFEASIRSNKARWVAEYKAELDAKAAARAGGGEGEGGAVSDSCESSSDEEQELEQELDEQPPLRRLRLGTSNYVLLMH